ncbi:phosphoribosylglycinamide formyltransferase [Curtobacterium sp. MCLR17_007]|uniref:phosphoribosylglycinamide formyltransferase n=1 Tax=unclassified Curtobacterium TaxID=257496 RepID=UPI0006F2C4C6|nr:MULTISPECIES: phosphoribosylglycinamide formyltransferase [unclassified Curtobacterium]KQS10184.1 phosphoribosylglycinamide formyltransferase [Curtobacterium sp. Leaf183]WIB59911.1 phosphoribosylglycinamide formyltransferase [Curtobacterium sp. MCLR17_007]
MLELVVLISGAGSNLRALLEATRDAEYPARVVAIGADRDAEGLGLGEEYSIPTFSVPYSRYDSRADWGQALAEQIRPWSPDLLVLSGLMRLLPPAVVSEFGPAVINTHPAYLPEFPGAHGVRDALAAGVSETGASVIQVDDGVDSGPILAQERVPVLPHDSESTLHDRIKPVERRLLIQTVLDIANGHIDLKGTTSA